ncbi:Phenazine biosynthesis-like domain-containing protein 1 [Portunus trituberculatus]|uniref:Phenazine biosynthesis-like domain-containing protein 1 n=1 Tax=Portunus trituberculatus TaxID=210409 RepID=A0A5B7JAJ5_PORTR|nr:Phenazine biosynthesis-like domain-containing protein 1 [Portunus trituberculatus]
MPSFVLFVCFSLSLPCQLTILSYVKYSFLDTGALHGHPCGRQFSSRSPDLLLGLIRLDNKAPMLDEKTLQQVASELNLSETAYVAPLAEGKASWQECDRFSLRWFTPTNEVPLCGHATLATSHVLLHCLGNSNTRLKFETKSGTLVARRDDHCIILDFPANPPETLTPAEETQLSELVKVASGGLLVSQVLISRTTRKLLVRLHPSCTR